MQIKKIETALKKMAKRKSRSLTPSKGAARHDKGKF